MKWIFLLVFFVSTSAWTQTTIQKIKSEAKCGKYEKFEVQLQLDQQTHVQVNRFVFQNDTLGINPFNPKQVNVVAVFIAPSGKRVKRFAFYYQPYKENTLFDRWDKDTTAFPWRIRFAPDEIGTWNVEVFYHLNQGISSQKTTVQFECIPSRHKGYLTVDSNSNRYLTYSENGKPFFSVSNNISSGGFYSYKPSQNNRHLKGVKQLIDVGGNFTRFDMQPQAALPDWPLIDNYKHKLDEMYAFDKVVELCESNDVYFIVFRHHVELLDSRTNPGGSDWSGVSWFDNPYRKMLELQAKKDYFSDSIAKEWQMNSLRYVFSRWGYSPNFSFYGYSEVDNWYRDLLADETKLDPKFKEEQALTLFKDWFVDQKQFILDSLNERMLFSNSFSALPPAEKKKHFEGLFSVSDIISLHDYGSSKNVNYQNRFHALTTNYNRFQKPVLLEEMGLSDNKLKIYCCTGIEYHNSIWSTAMMGGIGTGMDWWWDRGVQDFGYHLHLKPLSDFFKNIPLNQLELTPQKWSDGTVDKRTIENFALVSQNKDTVLGWVHNATFYWRNLVKEMPCLQELMEKGKLTYPCFVGEGHDLNEEGLGDYALPRFEDDYSMNGGVQPIVNAFIELNPIFKIKHLKKSIGISRNWYKVTFFEVNESVLVRHKQATQVVSSNVLGEIQLLVPNMDYVNPDYAYKIEFIGKSRRNRGVLISQ